MYSLSAGGTFISLHILAYGGEQGAPFHQAWMMSGPPGTALNITSEITTHHTISVAEKLGCETGTDEPILHCLRQVPMQVLMRTAMAYSIENHPPTGVFTFLPSLDDDIFTESPLKLMREGKFVKGKHVKSYYSYVYKF